MVNKQNKGKWCQQPRSCKFLFVQKLFHALYHGLYVPHKIFSLFYKREKLRKYFSMLAHAICLFSMMTHAIYLFSMIAHTICLFSMITHAICLFSEIALANCLFSMVTTCCLSFSVIPHANCLFSDSMIACAITEKRQIACVIMEKYFRGGSFTASCNNFEECLHNVIKQRGVSYLEAQVHIQKNA